MGKESTGSQFFIGNSLVWNCDSIDVRPTLPDDFPELSSDQWDVAAQEIIAMMDGFLVREDGQIWVSMCDAEEDFHKRVPLKSAMSLLYSMLDYDDSEADELSLVVQELRQAASDLEAAIADARRKAEAARQG